MFRKGLIGIALGLLALPAMAINLTWIAPTQREDGTALAASEIASYTLNVTLAGVAQPSVSIPGTATAYTFVDTVKGKYCFTLVIVDTAGLTSALSNQACRNANPKAATGVSAK